MWSLPEHVCVHRAYSRYVAIDIFRTWITVHFSLANLHALHWSAPAYWWKHLLCKTIFFVLWRCGPTRTMASSFMSLLDHTKRRTTVGRTPLDKLSSRRRDIYLTIHNTHNKHPCPRGDSNPKSQEASGHRPTPEPRGQWDLHLHIIAGYYSKHTGLHKCQVSSSRAWWDLLFWRFGSLSFYTGERKGKNQNYIE